jgi:hypothetical protein
VKHLKILIASDGMHAHFFERQGWLNAFNCIPGIEAVMYDSHKYSPFDVFDRFEPDIFLGQLYNIDRPTYKCILERPNLKVALRAGDWGDFQNTFDHDKHPTMLFSTENDLNTLKKMLDETGQPEFVFNHYDQQDIERTHNYFADRLNVKIIGLPLAADLLLYGGGQFKKEYECDLSFIGGWWSNKAKNIDKCLRPLCHPVGAYKIKVFARNPWPHLPQYCGGIEDESLVKHIFASSKICPNISEPHSTEFGIDMNERSFKTLCAGGFCIYDNVAAARRIYSDDEVVFYNDENDFRKIVDHYLIHTGEAREIAQRGQQKVLSAHTYFDRANTILQGLGINLETSFRCVKENVINDKINNLQ